MTRALFFRAATLSPIGTAPAMTQYHVIHMCPGALEACPGFDFEHSLDLDYCISVRRRDTRYCKQTRYARVNEHMT